MEMCWRQILNYLEYSKEMPSEMRALTVLRSTLLKMCVWQILPGEIMGVWGITLAHSESKKALERGLAGAGFAVSLIQVAKLIKGGSGWGVSCLSTGDEVFHGFQEPEQTQWHQNNSNFTWKQLTSASCSWFLPALSSRAISVHGSCAPSSSRGWECRIKGCCSVFHCMERLWCFTTEEGGKNALSRELSPPTSQETLRMGCASHLIPFNIMKVFPRENELLLFSNYHYYYYYYSFFLLKCPQIEHCNRDLISSSSHSSSASAPHLGDQSTGNMICKVETPPSRRKGEIPCLSTVEQPRVPGTKEGHLWCSDSWSEMKNKDKWKLGIKARFESLSIPLSLQNTSNLHYLVCRKEGDKQ